MAEALQRAEVEIPFAGGWALKAKYKPRMGFGLDGGTCGHVRPSLQRFF